MNNIEGISFRNNNGNIVKTTDKNLIEDLDSIEFPEFSQFDLSCITPKMLFLFIHKEVV